MPLADRKEIQHILDGLRRSAGTPESRLDNAGRLFAQLNYERSPRRPLRVDLAADVRQQVVGSPAIIATGGDDEGFLVIHTQFKSDGLSRVVERAVITAVLKDYPYSLFVFSNADHARWHFVNVKVARKCESGENRDAKLRRFFRRISISAEDRLRTAIERIELLDVAKLSPDLFGISALTIQGLHDEAFDVEAVTRDFFKKYRETFETVEGAIKGVRGPELRRLYTQRLFNRLMFISFIQKKGWLKFPSMEDNEYLEALWRDHNAKAKDAAKEPGNFYTDRLSHLFFRGLNNPAHLDLLATNRGKSAPDSFLQRRIGDVPYLNGGLFEKSDDGTDDDAAITVPDKAIRAIVEDLFARFNFTVTESTPLDVEVAVDPEMLGKVFEELVTGRHESGSYYTPKPIVSFMCREALKGHLRTKCPGETEAAIARFVDEHDASGIRDGEAILNALRTMRCCDPACGSGAYLLGMMHELLDLRACLFASDKKLDAKTAYERKLEIIQTNVYGVDLDEFAVNIARLRLWLSLAVDFTGDAPPPLPNLDFKIEAGDSLSAPDPSDAGQLQLQKPLVDEFLARKREFFKAHSTEKKPLKKKIDALREKIKAWTHTGSGLPDNAFDWQVEFAEVFIDGGFDAILANPPYVRQELIKDQKPRLKSVFGPLFSGTADLYVFFYLRGLQLLGPGGMLAYISSNKWFRAGYGEKLRAHIAKTTTVQTILDFHDLPVFEAVAYPMIFTAAKRPPAESHTATLAEPPDLEPPYPDVKEVVTKYGHQMPATALGRDGTWHLHSLAAQKTASHFTKAAGSPLRSLLGSDFYRGLSTGLNEAFVIDDATRKSILAADPGSKKVIKPYLAGKDVKRWHLEDRKLWIIYSTWDFDIAKFPGVAKHLKRFETQLKARPECRANRYKWWCMARYGSEYVTYFDKPKIVSTKVSVRPTFTLDTGGHYLGNTSYFATVTEEALEHFVLAVLNSSTFHRYAKETFVGKQSGWYEVQPAGLENFPIPSASAADRSAVGALAQKCLDAKGVGCEAWEKEIDERVAALYGL